MLTKQIVCSEFVFCHVGYNLIFLPFNVLESVHAKLEYRPIKTTGKQKLDF